MKHSKANTIPPPVFVNNKGLYGLTPISEDTALSTICGGIEIEKFDLSVLDVIPSLLTGLYKKPGTAGFTCQPALPVIFIPMVATIMAVPALITRKVTKSKYEKKLKETQSVEL